MTAKQYNPNLETFKSEKKYVTSLLHHTPQIALIHLQERIWSEKLRNLEKSYKGANMLIRLNQLNPPRRNPLVTRQQLMSVKVNVAVKTLFWIWKSFLKTANLHMYQVSFDNKHNFEHCKILITSPGLIIEGLRARSS